MTYPGLDPELSDNAGLRFNRPQDEATPPVDPEGRLGANQQLLAADRDSYAADGADPDDGTIDPYRTP